MDEDATKRKKEEKAIIKEATILSASTYIFQILMLIRGFVIARFLGPSLYGVWTMIRTLFQTEKLLGLGTTNAMMRQVPMNAAQGKPDENFVLQQNCLTLRLFLSSLIAVGIVILSVTDIVVDYKTEMRWAGLVFVLNGIWFFIPAKLISEKKVPVLSKFRLLYGILNTIFGISLLLIFEIQGLLIGVVITNIIIFYYLVDMGHLSFQLKFDPNMLKGLIITGYPMLILSLSFFLMKQIDKVLVFLMLGSVSTGYYGLAAFLSGTINQIPATFTAVLFPRMMYKISRSRNRNDIEEFYTLPIFVFARLLPILFGIVYININIPIYYFLPQYVSAINTVQVLVIASFFFVIWEIPKNVLVGFGKQKQLMKGTLVLIVFGILLDISILRMGYGIFEVAIASAFTYFLISFMSNIYALFIFGKRGVEAFTIIINIYGPLFYTLCGLSVITLLTWPEKMIATEFFQTLLFLLYCTPLIILVEKKNGIFRKIYTSWRRTY